MPLVSALLLCAACASGGVETAGGGGDITALRQGSGVRDVGVDPAARCPSRTTRSAETPIRIRVGESVLAGSLGTSPAAKALIARLPLTIRFSDFDNVEKTGPIAALPMDDMPDGSDPGAGTVGYYAPDDVLVLYYRDVGYFDGIADLGEFSDEGNVISDQTSDFSATMEVAC